MALLTTEDVLNKKFQYVKFREGYDQDEVDEFLDEVVSTIYSLQTENQALKESLEAAERRIGELSSGAAPYLPAETVVAPMVDTEAQERLADAERQIAELNAALEQARAEAAAASQYPAEPAAQAPASSDGHESATSMLALAQRVHDEYVRDGREESDRIISEARAKGDEIVADAQRQHETILDQLDQERGLLESKINELRGFESEYRSNLRSHLETLLSEVNKGGEA